MTKTIEKPLETVVIDVKSWTTGEECNGFGKCCALGFVAKSRLKRLGIKNPTKDQIIIEAGTLPSLGRVVDINDNLRGEKRRKELRKEFKKFGIHVIFKNLKK